MSDPERITGRKSLSLGLRHGDQVAVATLIALALAAMAVYWWRQGGWQGRFIDVERIPQRSPTFLVDINAAEWTELAQLPEIGETLARRIVEYRRAHGPFARIEDLLEVEGIGPRTLERMTPHLLPIGPPAGAERRPDAKARDRAEQGRNSPQKEAVVVP